MIQLSPTSESARPNPLVVAESPCCAYLLERISAIWQAFCTLLSDWAAWLFSPAPPPTAGAIQPKEETFENRILARTINDILKKSRRSQFSILPDFSKARPLLKERATLNAKRNGQTPLMMLLDSVGSNLPFTEKCFEFAQELIASLGAAGISLDDQQENNSERTPLCCAIGKIHLSPSFVSVAKSLIQNKADLDARSGPEEDTPLALAIEGAMVNESYCEILDLLLRKGASLGAEVECVDQDGARILGSLRWISSDPGNRAQHKAFNATLTAFEQERQAAIFEPTAFSEPLRNIIIDYLDGIDPWRPSQKPDAQVEADERGIPLDETYTDDSDFLSGSDID